MLCRKPVLVNYVQIAIDMYDIWDIYIYIYVRYASNQKFPENCPFSEWNTQISAVHYIVCLLLLGFQKQVAQYTKVINHVLEITNKAREEWESEAGARATQAQTYSTADTHTLLAAVYAGKGLKVNNKTNKMYLQQLKKKKELYVTKEG